MTTKRYFEIRGGIMLGFFNGREQYDVLIEAGQGHLMFDGADIYWIFEGRQRMSDTINNAIAVWLEQERIAETAGPPDGRPQV
jgi:hypothetical protein